MSRKRRPAPELREAQLFLKALRANDRVIEADSEDVPLPPGVTHVLIRKHGDQPERLVEKRKSFF